MEQWGRRGILVDTGTEAQRVTDSASWHHGVGLDNARGQPMCPDEGTGLMVQKSRSAQTLGVSPNLFEPQFPQI